MVTAVSQTSNSFAWRYSIPLPVSITPSNGPTNGGYTVVIQGSRYVRMLYACVSLASLTKVMICRQKGKKGGQLNYVPFFFSYCPHACLVASFGTSGSVTIGTLPCPQVGPWDQTSITCSLPANAGRNQVVRVTVASQVKCLSLVNAHVCTCAARTHQHRTQHPSPARSHTQVSTAAINFNYDAPEITDISPLTGPTGGGSLITITGINFGPSLAIATTVRIGTYTFAPLTQANTQIVATVAVGLGVNLVNSLTIAGQTTTNVRFLVLLRSDFVAPFAFSIAASPLSGFLFRFVLSPYSTPIALTSLNLFFFPRNPIDRYFPQPAFTFSYAAPSISDVTPVTGPTTGGTTITITGTEANVFSPLLRWLAYLCVGLPFCTGATFFAFRFLPLFSFALHSHISLPVP